MDKYYWAAESLGLARTLRVLENLAAKGIESQGCSEALEKGLAMEG